MPAFRTAAGRSILTLPPLAALQGDIFGSFINMPNGAPGLLSGGRPIVREPTNLPGGIVQSVISGGVLVTPDSGYTSTASYNFTVLKEDARSAYAAISFADAVSNDSVGLIGTVGTGQYAIGANSLHAVFTRTRVELSSYHWPWGDMNPTVTAVRYFDYPRAMRPGVAEVVGWRRANVTDLVFRYPDGSESVAISASAEAPKAGNVMCVEPYRGQAGTPGAFVHAVAFSSFANPAAAGRTNLLLSPNNLLSSDWLTGGPTVVQSNIADGDGGTLGQRAMEPNSNAYQSAYQSISKAAAPRRYSQRFKAKLIGENWATMQATDLSTATAKAFADLTNRVASPPVGTYQNIWSTIFPIDNGFTQFQMDYLTNNNATHYVGFGIAASDGVDTFVGNSAKGIIMYDQQLFERP